MSRGVASFCRLGLTPRTHGSTCVFSSGFAQLPETRTRTTGAAVVLMDLAGWRLDVNPHETLPA